MATFKKPKNFNPANRPAPSPKKGVMGADLGFSDSESGGESAHDSGSEDEKGSDTEAGGLNFLEYVGLQKSLRRATEQKMELADQLKKTQEALRKSESALARSQTNSKTQINMLQAAQRQQLEDKDKLIDSLKLTIEEMDEAATGKTEKSNGINKMVAQINELSNSKREQTTRADEAELRAANAAEDLEKMRLETEQKVAELQQEITELRGAIDPVKLDSALNRGEGASSAEVEALMAENQKLKDRIEIVEAQSQRATAVADSGVSSAQAERLERELKEKKQEIQSLRDELKDSAAKIAGLQVMSKSGSKADEAALAAQEALAKELSELKKTSRESANHLEELQATLKNEQASHARTKTQMDEIKANLDKELNKAQGAAAAGESAKKTVEQELASIKVELSNTSNKLKSESSAHEDTKAQLTDAKKQIAKLKEDITTVAGDMTAEIEAERQRHASAIQSAKAEAAAQLAEAKQRSADEMKDLRARMGKFSSVLKPMVETLKALKAGYKNIKKEMSDLSATIAPAVKQVKRDLLKTLAEVDKQYKEMLTKYRKEMALRKKLHNELVDLKGNIRVFCRLRPLIGEDGTGPDSKMVIKQDPRDEQMLIVDNKGKETVFEMDTIFTPASTQENVFEQARDLIVSVIDGFNVCIFAYGQTGSGKTFTMEGNDAHPGLNRRALRHLFEVVEEKKVDWSYEIEVSVLEIYNENLRDLLSDDKKNKLDIKHGKNGPHVPGLTARPVRNVQEVREQFDRAKSVRATASTDMNELSSRSHMILIVQVTGTNLSTGVQTTGKLNLIDLAGSERVSKSGAIDDTTRFKEATNINQSLSSLGDVIHALGAKQKHIPYRNSKLTHLLQDSLGGQAKTLMVVQISPVLKNVSESVCSLNFATRVRAVELGSAKKQTESAEVAALKKRIKELESA